MVAWLFEALAYAVLAGGVLAVNWHRRRTRLAAAALLAFSVFSSLTFFAHLPFELRLIREIVCVTALATLFAVLYAEGDGRRCYQIAMVLCVLDVAFCGALCLHASTALPARALFGWAVNLNFIGLCACVAAPGVRDAYVAWIADIERVRLLDSSAPDFDWALRNLDR